MYYVHFAAVGDEDSSCSEFSLISEDEGDDIDCDELEGMAPTRKNRRLANDCALQLSLRSGRYPKSHGFTGPYVAMDPSQNNPLDYFELLWPQHLVDVIVVETNRYARQKRVKNWLDVSRDEILAFLGIILLMGINWVPKMSDYWSKDPKVNNSVMKAHMTVKRFWAIWSNLHVVDNATLEPGHGLNAKLKAVVDTLRTTFFENYSPSRELSVDEAMVKYKGCVKQGKVKMSKKPIKCGFKIWCLSCSCCGYLCNFEFYEGRPIDPITGKKKSDKGMVRRVVERLCEPFEGMGHVLYLDNYFTSGPLVEGLRKKGIFLAGTIKQRARGFPEELKKLDLSVGDIATAEVGKSEKNRIVYSVFKDRKVVSFVANAFPPSMNKKVARLPPNGRVLRCQKVPPVLPAYNKYMGGVDRTNQLAVSYGFDRKCRRYWFRPFMACLDFAVDNAYLLYRHNCVRFKAKLKDSLDFRKDLIDELLRDTLYRRRKASRDVWSGPSCTDGVGVCRLARVSSIGLSRGRCHQCLRNRKKQGVGKVGFTDFGCSCCKIRLCKIDCFDQFHRQF